MNHGEQDRVRGVRAGLLGAAQAPPAGRPDPPGDRELQQAGTQFNTLVNLHKEIYENFTEKLSKYLAENI